MTYTPNIEKRFYHDFWRQSHETGVDTHEIGNKIGVLAGVAFPAVQWTWGAPDGVDLKLIFFLWVPARTGFVWKYMKISCSLEVDHHLHSWNCNLEGCTWLYTISIRFQTLAWKQHSQDCAPTWGLAFPTDIELDKGQLVGKDGSCRHIKKDHALCIALTRQKRKQQLGGRRHICSLGWCFFLVASFYKAQTYWSFENARRFTFPNWVCLKIVYPQTQWFCWSLSLLNGYFIGNIPYFQTSPFPNSCYKKRMHCPGVRALRVISASSLSQTATIQVSCPLTVQKCR